MRKLAVKIDNQLMLREVRTGKHAGFTKNESVVYPQMMLNKPVITPVGPKATVATPRGEPTSAYDFIIIKFNS